MEYTNKESFIKRFFNKIKNSTLGSIFSSKVDILSDDELEKIISSTGIPIAEAQILESEFRKAKDNLYSEEINYENDESTDKFRVKGINPKAPVTKEPNLDGHNIEREMGD